jgi:subtilase family serine protease
LNQDGLFGLNGLNPVLVLQFGVKLQYLILIKHYYYRFDTMRLQLSICHLIVIADLLWTVVAATASSASSSSSAATASTLMQAQNAQAGNLRAADNINHDASVSSNANWHESMAPAHPLRRGFTKARPAAAHEQHQLVFHIKQRNLDTLAQRIEEVSDPASKTYQQWLSFEDVAELTANVEGADAVIDWLNSNNIQVR